QPRHHPLLDHPLSRMMTAETVAVSCHTRRVLTMKAGVASPDGVVIKDVDQPKPKSADLLIKVKAIALNRADLGSARGDTSHGAATGKPIGSEFSGEVIE